MRSLTIGGVYRYARPYDSTLASIDGLANYFSVVRTPGEKLPLLEAGINPIAQTRAVDGARIAAILISSSPHKTGSSETPWEDTFDSDNGSIIYYGDNKDPSKDPTDAPGNRALLRAFSEHSSPDIAVRAKATPLFFFQRVAHSGRQKGQVRFHGFGVVSRAERVTQLHRKHGHYFTNYRFEFTVLSSAFENEQIDWRWIDARRDSTKTITETNSLSPATWRAWIANGSTAIDRLRRRVSTLMVSPTSEQRPSKGSGEERILNEVYRFYDGKKHRFEALASIVTGSIISRSGVRYHEGWITPGTSDEGIDFIGRVDLGNGFARTRLVLLGQAKCEAPSAVTGGINVARTVARLRRGWIGAYVTTSYFSDKVQREIIEDQYPVVRIQGLDLSREVEKLSLEKGFSTVGGFLKDVDGRYESMVRQRRAEEILRD